MTTKTWNGNITNYTYGKVWGSIDPRSGDINIYTPDISNKIEDEYIEYITSPQNERVVIPEFSATIYFKDNNYFIQKTKGGLRSVFRYEVPAQLAPTKLVPAPEPAKLEHEEEVDNCTIVLDVEYNKNYKSWYLSISKTTHIGLLVDTSGSMRNIYGTIIEKCLEEFIEKQKTEIKNNALFYGITFSDKINTVFDGVDLHKEENLKEVFYKITPGGLTAYRDAYIEMIEKINKRYRLNDEIIICCMTDGQDNSSKFSREYLKKCITDCKNKGWLFVMFGTKEVDLDNLDIGLLDGECLEIGLSKVQTHNAYTSLNANINSVRSGVAQQISFSECQRMASK